MNGPVRGSVLRYAHAAGTELLVDANGHPVWPVAGARELAALRSLAQLHGFQLTESDVRPAPEPIGAGSRDVVVAYGLADPAVAELYAHLTGRAAYVASSLDDIPPRTAVVLTVTSALSPELFQRLSALCDDRLPGVIYGRSETSLATAAKLRAAALLEAAPAHVERSFVYARSDFPARTTDAEMVLGARADVGEVRRALGSGAAIATTLSHSDGIHMGLTWGVAFCPFEQLHEDEERRPLCLQLDRCVRYPALPSVREMWQSGKAIAPREVSARIFIAYGCSALRTGDSTLNPHLGLSSMAEEATYGVILTNYQDSGAADTAVHDVINDLGDGVPAGRAVAAFNASPAGREAGADLVLIGDPEYAIPPLRAVRRLPNAMPRTASVEPPFIDGGASTATDLAFMRLCVAIAQEKSAYVSADAVEKARSAIAACEVLQFSASSSSARWTAALADVQHAVLELLIGLPRFEYFWSGLGRLVSVDRSKDCPVCGCGIAVSRYSFPIRGARPRLVANCPRCGEIANAPEGVDAQLVLDELALGRIGVAGAARDARASVALISRYHPYSSGAHWPLAHGSLAAAFDLHDLEIPEGPLLLRVHVAHELQVTALLVKTRYDAARAQFMSPKEKDDARMMTLA